MGIWLEMEQQTFMMDTHMRYMFCSRCIAFEANNVGWIIDNSSHLVGCRSGSNCDLGKVIHPHYSITCPGQCLVTAVFLLPRAMFLLL